jgi:hypothetical protein
MYSIIEHAANHLLSESTQQLNVVLRRATNTSFEFNQSVRTVSPLETLVISVVSAKFIIVIWY